MDHSQPLFIYFRLFNSQQETNVSYKTNRWWLDSNPGPLVSEASVPQPLPQAEANSEFSFSISKIHSFKSIEKTWFGQIKVNLFIRLSTFLKEI